MASETTPLTTTNAPDAERGEEQVPSSPPQMPNFYQRVKDAHAQSEGPLDFLKAFLMILVDTIGFVIFVGILLAIPIAMIVVGALNLDDCPVQHFIPLWLLVSGSVFAFVQVVYILRTGVILSLPQRRSDDRVSKTYGVFNTILLLFSFAWFIAGNVWVFTVYPPNITDSSDALYCEAGVYYFSFAVIIAIYAWMLFSFCCSGIVAIAGIKDLAHQVSSKVTTTMKSGSSSAGEGGQ